MDLRKTVREIIKEHPSGRGSAPIIPGAVVVEKYSNGQARTYLVERERVTRRQYIALVEKLRASGQLPPRERTQTNGPEQDSA